MGQVHDQIIFALFCHEHITFLQEHRVLYQVHFSLNGEQLRGKGNLSWGIRKQKIHSFTDRLKVPCKPTEIKIEQYGEYQQNGKQNHGIHMAAKYPLVQLERRIVFYSKGSLKKRHHPISEAAAQ